MDMLHSLIFFWLWRPVAEPRPTVFKMTRRAQGRRRGRGGALQKIFITLELKKGEFFLKIVLLNMDIT